MNLTNIDYRSRNDQSKVFVSLLQVTITKFNKIANVTLQQLTNRDACNGPELGTRRPSSTGVCRYHNLQIL